MKSSSGEFSCDFCGASQHSTSLIVVGANDVGICSECIDLAVDVRSRKPGAPVAARADEAQEKSDIAQIRESVQRIEAALCGSCTGGHVDSKQKDDELADKISLLTQSVAALIATQKRIAEGGYAKRVEALAASLEETSRITREAVQSEPCATMITRTEEGDHIVFRFPKACPGRFVLAMETIPLSFHVMWQVGSNEATVPSPLVAVNRS